MEKLISFFGLAVMISICYALSTSRKNIKWKTIISGIFLQLGIGLIILKTAIGFAFFERAKNFFLSLLSYGQEGASFVFGSLATGTLSGNVQTGFIFVTMVVPSIIFFSSLMGVLYHLGIMQKIINLVATLMRRVMGTSGAESFAAAANIFIGQTEAPLAIKPYLNKMTQSELLALMTGGMATVAGGVLIAYVGLGINGGHLLAASVMSAPAALVCAKLMIPETEKSETAHAKAHAPSKTTKNIIDAAATGAEDGLKLSLNVVAMLIAFIALVAMLNGILSYMGSLVGYSQLSLELITGYLFTPIAFLLGVPWDECLVVGSLLAKKLILNEFVAYLDLTSQLKTLSPRSITISTYALCGFANLSSVAIQVGGIGALVPSRRKDLASLGLKSLIAGTIACLMTATIAGIFV